MTSPFIYRDFNGLLPAYSLVCIENKWGSRFKALLYKTILPIYFVCFVPRPPPTTPLHSTQ